MDSNSKESVEPRRVNSLETVSSSSDILQKAKPCHHKIGGSKYERPSKTDQIWWAEKFQSLEDRSKLPFYKRRNHLENCFSKETMRKLYTAGVEMNPDWGQDIVYKPKEPLVKPSSKCEIAPPKELQVKTCEPDIDYTNPYLNFFRKSKKNAQVWRPKPKPSLDKLPLIQKAENLEIQIATEFDEWFSNVGSKKKTEIDKDVILSIFEIVMSYPVMTSIAVKTVEVGCVPEMTAKYLHFPEKSEGASVQREIKKDINAGKMKPLVVAFSKTLPIELQRKPFTENLKEKWFEYQIHHQDIETMAAVWQGITELHTTRVFLDWLLAHPDVTPPPYFLEEGILDKIFVVKSLLDLNIEELQWEPAPMSKESNRRQSKLKIGQTRRESRNSVSQGREPRNSATRNSTTRISASETRGTKKQVETRKSIRF